MDPTQLANLGEFLGGVRRAPLPTTPCAFGIAGRPPALGAIELPV